ncbi:hypothetical protein [Sphingomonas sp.]|uniref:hypothetical protein n=1 Tax=Sphingomonas sp. TaxID=28214 RepID=UPI002E2F7399|nr:hypothetical protein [Sphingomonas sp.]HEX4693022.1 hypothetical protein [Sphingomonas sp.]
MSDAAVGDAFETVAVTWSQPECAVMLSMFEFYGIPAFATGRWHGSAYPPMITGLDGFHVRVHPAVVDDALELLAEVSERPAAVRPYPLGQRWIYPALIGLTLVILVEFWLSDNPGPLMVTVLLALCFLFYAVPPTRTASTFFLWKRPD